MIVQCPQCQSKYKVDDTKLAGRTQVTVRCTKCDSNFTTPLAPPAPASVAEVPAPPAGASPAANAPSAPAAPPEATRGALLGPPELPADKSFSLAATQGPVKGQVFPITKPRVEVGRAGTDIVVSDPEISRRHCALEIHGESAVLVDLGSTNGTFVDDARIESREIEHLSEFRVGQSTLMFTVTNKQ